MLDVLVALLIVGGAFFAFVAGLGVLRMPDIMIRMHASTKAGTLGCGMILLAVALHFQDAATTSRAIAAILFILITAPVAAHMIGRAAYRTGVRLWHGNVIDEMAAGADDGRQSGAAPSPDGGAGGDSQR